MTEEKIDRECQECGARIKKKFGFNTILWKYCPYCGAKY